MVRTYVIIYQLIAGMGIAGFLMYGVEETLDLVREMTFLVSNQMFEALGTEAGVVILMIALMVWPLFKLIAMLGWGYMDSRKCTKCKHSLKYHEDSQGHIYQCAGRKYDKPTWRFWTMKSKRCNCPFFELPGLQPV